MKIVKDAGLYSTLYYCKLHLLEWLQIHQASQLWWISVLNSVNASHTHPGRKYNHYYDVPNRRKICGLLLDSAYEDTSVQPTMDRAKRYGGTLTSDGWSNVQLRPITSFMLVTRESSVFMKSVDSTDHMADKNVQVG